ncbi:MAG: hypothetical protein RMJ66_01550 [Bacteroidia bacterium]|nr:hypothetical protein [Bacteroidia bacterium]MDW8133730.1 hypothetical protein [Bacteroidia bacterium]
MRWLCYWFLFTLGSAQNKLQFYTSSEFILMRFHKSYLPPLFSAGAMGGSTFQLIHSGISHRGYIWGELRLMYLLSGGMPPIFPGATGGFSWRVGLPEPDRYYIQVGIGLDFYSIRKRDAGVSIHDTQLRPIIYTEVGSFTLLEPLFLRYGFYPTPGSTSKFVFSIGTYLLY